MWVFMPLNNNRGWKVGFQNPGDSMYITHVYEFPPGEEGKKSAAAMTCYLNGGRHPTVNKWEGVITPHTLDTIAKERDMWEMLCRCGYSYLNDESFEAIRDAIENFSFFDELNAALVHIESPFSTAIQEAIALTRAPDTIKPTMFDSDFDDPEG